MIRCCECAHWQKDGNGGWGVCMSMLAAQNVEHWEYQKSLTFRTFGCVCAKEKNKEDEPKSFNLRRNQNGIVSHEA